MVESELTIFENVLAFRKLRKRPWSDKFCCLRNCHHCVYFGNGVSLCAIANNNEGFVLFGLRLAEHIGEEFETIELPFENSFISFFVLKEDIEKLILLELVLSHVCFSSLVGSLDALLALRGEVDVDGIFFCEYFNFLWWKYSFDEVHIGYYYN